MDIGNTPQRPLNVTSSERIGKTERAESAQAVQRQSLANPNLAQTGARPEPVTASPQASAQVALSSSAVQILQGGDATESFDQAKVEQLATEIREGRFQINAERIADRLLASARELLKPQESSAPPDRPGQPTPSSR